MGSLQYSSSKHGDVTLVSVSGSLDAETAPKFNEKLQNEINKGATKILCNLSNTDFIASAGLGVLISNNQALSKSGGEIRLAGLNEKIKKIFKVMGFINIFKIYNNNDDGIKSFK